MPGERIVLNTLGSADEIFGLGMSDRKLRKGDLRFVMITVFLSVVPGYFITGWILFGSPFHPSGFVSLLSGVVGSTYVLYRTPPDRSAMDYVSDRINWRWQPQLLTLSNDENGDSVGATQIKRFRDQWDLVERTDGAYTTNSSIDGKPMDAVGDDGWNKVSSSFRDAINNSRGGIEISMMGWMVSLDDIIGDIDERIQQPDVQGEDVSDEVNEVFLRAILSHETELRDQAQNRGVSKRTYTISTDVEPDEVERHVGRTEGWEEKRLIGPAFAWMQNRGWLHTEDKGRLSKRMRNELERRHAIIENGIRSISIDSGVSSGSTSVDQQYNSQTGADVEAYWTGRKERINREHYGGGKVPVVLAATEREDINDEY